MYESSPRKDSQYLYEKCFDKRTIRKRQSLACPNGIFESDVTTRSGYGSAPRVLLLRPRSGTLMTPRTTTLDVDVSRHQEEIDHQRAVWMAAAQVGDRVAYERLLHDYIPLIKRVARRQGIPFDCIDDVVQETLLTVHQARH
jgi:hypothetical protein